MPLELEITRAEGKDTQVRCFLDGALLSNFFGFEEGIADADIGAQVTAYLRELGIIP